MTQRSMQLVIPMSGLGSRFLRAGYDKPKPMIEVLGKPMIEWVLKMFPGEFDPIFICRKDHIENTSMGETLRALKPNGKIISIEGAKLGPVDALLKAREFIEDSLPTIISYCDYYMHWDYLKFKEQIFSLDIDGAVPCYSGFHPHLIPIKNLYACCNVDSENFLTEIREKYSFTLDKTKSLHSPGVYYFRSGRLFKDFANKLMSQKDSLNGEYYVSMVYKHMVLEGLKVYCPPNISHFCQWGTPQDLNDFLYWTKLVGNFL